MNKLIKGDEVVVIAGKNKGARGRILQRVSPELVLVDGVNVVKKHTKPNPMKDVPGGINEKIMPVHQSNVAIWNAANGKADRVRIKVSEQVLDDGAKKRVLERLYASTGEVIKTVWSRS